SAVIEQSRTGISHNLSCKTGISLDQIGQLKDIGVRISSKMHNSDRGFRHRRQLVKALEFARQAIKRKRLSLIIWRRQTLDRLRPDSNMPFYRASHRQTE